MVCAKNRLSFLHYPFGTTLRSALVNLLTHFVLPSFMLIVLWETISNAGLIKAIISHLGVFEKLFMELNWRQNG
jgi:hypothetical protein